MQIVCISWLETFKLRIESIVGVGRGCDLHDLTKMLCLFHRLLGPSTRIDIGSLLDEEVGRNLHKLQRRTTTKEDNGVTLRNVKKLLEKGDSLINNWLEILSTVADFHQ